MATWLLIVWSTTMRVFVVLREKLSALAAAAFLVSGLLVSAPANAMSLDWTLTGPGTTNATNLANTGVGNYLATGVGNSSQSWTLSTTALETRTYYFDWVFQGFHGLSDVTAFLGASNAGSLVDAGPSNIGTPPSGGFFYSGTRLAWNATTGDTLFFNFGGSNGDSGATNVLAGTVTVTSVPLPLPFLMLVAAIACIAGLRLRRAEPAGA